MKKFIKGFSGVKVRVWGVVALAVILIVCLFVSGKLDGLFPKDDAVYFAGNEKKAEAAFAMENEMESVGHGETEIPEVADTAEPPIYVHITGAVVVPGVYALRYGARVIDAVNAAGGLLSDAEPESVNLSKIVRDEQQIKVYTKEEWQSKDVRIENDDGGGDTVLSGGAVVPNHYTADGRLDINKATKEEFMKLPGIGDKIADYIIEYRDANGGFETVGALKNVQRIGDKTFKTLEPLIVAEP